MTLTFGSLFAGIGGIDLGLERSGMRCQWQVEIDDYATRVLAKHWPNVPRHRDVRECGADNLAAVDLICGGFPCQDISGAGKQAGIDGSRSGLWREFARIIRELRPRYALVENVANLLSGGNGRWFGRVLGDLAAFGYDAEWECIPAAALGAPHERDRLFLIAFPSSSTGRRRVFPDRLDGIPRDGQWSAAQNIKSGRGWKRWLVATCAALDQQSNNSWFRGMDDGLPSELDRLRGLGNAVVPQVAEWIGQQIIAYEASL